MAALKGVKTLDMVDGEITKVAYEGEEYEKTDRPVREGDLFLLKEGHLVGRGEVGAFYSTKKYEDGDIVIPTAFTGNASNTQSIGKGVAFRKKHVRLKVGDYAKVVGDTYNSDIVRGAIVKITNLADGDGDLRFELVGDDYYDYAKPSSLEKVSAEEVKWAEIGRKGNEYKVGDIVSYDDPQWFENKGIGEVTEASDEDDYTGVVATDNGGRRIKYYLLPKKLTLITPVEARFDRS
ncbi:hypothetical protein ACRPLG_02585 [Bacillus safensis]|uniref:hypothetical protein n=1 Tax=Bacillus safensis TaxID=561879 RepID=UPI003D7736CE